MREPVEAPASYAIQRLMLAVAQAVSAGGLYPSGHPRIAEAAEALVARLEDAVQERRQNQLTLLLVDDDLLVDQRPFRVAGYNLRGFIHTLRRMNVEGLTLVRGLDAHEVTAFVTTIAETGQALSTGHLVVGRVKLAFSGDDEKKKTPPAIGWTGDDGGLAAGASSAGTRAGDGTAAGGGGGSGGGPGTGSGAGAGSGSGAGSGAGKGSGLLALDSGVLDHAQEAFTRFRTDAAGALSMMETLVWSFIDAMVHATELIYPLARLRDHDELTYVHSVNVSLLVLAQARAFGFRGETLKEIGLGALLHDLGKLSLPPALLNKTEPLTEEEWRQVQRHPELGATRLFALDPDTRIPALVAYEHHLRYDGKPGYPVLRKPRQPILASLMTSVADSFDAMQTARPYSRRYSRPAALAVLRERAGTYLDPILVESFCRLFAAPPAA